MKIIVVCPGKLKDKWLKEGIDEYKKRLSRFATLDFIEVAGIIFKFILVKIDIISDNFLLNKKIF